MKMRTNKQQASDQSELGNGGGAHGSEFGSSRREPRPKRSWKNENEK